MEQFTLKIFTLVTMELSGKPNREKKLLYRAVMQVEASLSGSAYASDHFVK